MRSKSLLRAAARSAIQVELRIMKTRSSVLTLLVILGLFLSACSSAPSPKSTETAAVLVPATAEPTATAAPSPTPLPGKVLLIAADETAAQPMQALLTELSQPAGLTLETRPQLQKGDLTPEIKLVIFFTPPGDLMDFLSAAPQVQFIAFSAVDLPSAGNLSVIREQADVQAFVGGYISALLSTDYRAAGLLPADGPLGANLQEAFANGGHYFCGVCAPGWPLGMTYPQIKALPAASDGPTWQSAAADLFDNGKAEIFFVSPEAARPEVFAYLQNRVQFENTVLLVGTQPPPVELAGQWAASVQFDQEAALRQVWPDALAGKGGAVVDAPLLLNSVNADLLGAGRLRLVKQLMEQIQAGQVSVSTIPPQ